MLNFVTDDQRHIALTATFCEKLHRLELLDPMSARFQLTYGQDAQIQGFMAVDQ